MNEKKRDGERLDPTYENMGFEVATTVEKLQEELRKRTGSDRVHVVDLYWFKPVHCCQFEVRVDRVPGDTRKPFVTTFVIRSNDGIESTLNFAAGWLAGLPLNPRA